MAKETHTALAGGDSPGNPSPSTKLADRLERALPAPRAALLRVAARAAEARGFALYIVGGFVRDLWLGLPSQDFDLVVEGDALRLARDLADAHGGAVVSHPRFGTAKWLLDRDRPALRKALGASAATAAEIPERVDFATARTEVYEHPPALPSVERGGIEADLRRRDFTINTLALRLDGEAFGTLLDPWGGTQDLGARRIRVLHDQSFRDDPTRLLRAVRLAHRLEFRIDPATLALIEPTLPLLVQVSGERLRHELDLSLDEPRPAPVLHDLAELGVLGGVHPALTWEDWLEDAFQRAWEFRALPEWNLSQVAPARDLRYALWTIRRSREEVASLAGRLRVSRRENETWLESQRLHAELPLALGKGEKPSRLTEMLDQAGAVAQAAVWLAAESDVRESVGAYWQRWSRVQAHTDGASLRAAGLPPGPAYREILAGLRAAWLDGEITSEEEEIRLRTEWVARVLAHG